MSFGLLPNLQTRFLLPCTVILLLPGLAKSDRNRANSEVENRGAAQGRTVTVLYEGPLVHDQDWTIRAGPAGPDNQKFRALGGTCSMIPSDVHNVAGSGFERVTFEAEWLGLGLSLEDGVG